MLALCHWPSVNLEIAKNIFWEYWLNNFLSYFPGTKTLAKFRKNLRKSYQHFWPLSYESLNDTRFSDNRLCTWPAGIALPRGGECDAYWFLVIFVVRRSFLYQNFGATCVGTKILQKSNCQFYVYKETAHHFFYKIYNFMRHFDSFHGLETDARLVESLISNVN